MIKPTRYTDPYLGVLNVSATLLKLAQVKSNWSFLNLSEETDKALKKECGSSFYYALDLMYLLGKVEYDIYSDKVKFLIHEIK